MDELCRKYPRRSAEIWVEDNYDDIYIDPIALLGANTPYSDLGLMYSKKDDERGIERLCYMAAMPAATGALNCYTPGGVGGKKEKEKYSMELDGAGRDQNQTTENQINIAQVVVRAIEQTPWVQFVKRLMEADEQKLSEPQIQNEPQDGLPQQEPQEPQGQLNGAQENVNPLDDEEEDEVYAEYVPDSEEDESQEAAKNENQDKISTAPQQKQNNVESVASTPQDAAEKQASGDEQSIKEEPFNNDSEGKESMEETNARLDALEKKVDMLVQVVRKNEETNTNVARYAKLESLARDRVFDLEEERQRCCYEKMSNEAFEEHVKSIEANYRRTPTAIDVPSGLVSSASQDDAARPGRVMYSKEKLDEIEAEVMRRGIANGQIGKYQSASEIRAQVEQEIFGGNQ